ncbi:MAG: acetylxylan esterase, partial [Kiritimatiellae bacterium]|nr:acetylxylan esterase [Kiritimatiellia bacterium]
MRLVETIMGLMLFTIPASASDKLSPPDPLTTSAGNKVTTPAQWQQTRRPEILELFRTNVYGRAPLGRPKALRFDVVETDKNAMGGKA